MTLVQPVKPTDGVDLGAREAEGQDARNASATAIQPAVARALIAALEQECAAYCILTGYEHLPEHFDTGIDFMVSREDFPRIPALIARVAERTGKRLLQSTQHEVSARAYFLVRQSGAKLSFVQPDSTADYQHFGRTFLHADEVLRSRRWHPNGFWIPGAAVEFFYYLMKRLNKRDFTATHAARLSRLFAEDPRSARALLARVWSGEQLAALETMAASAEWSRLQLDVRPFRQTLAHYSAAGPVEKEALAWQRAVHTLDRILRPTGACISFMGPDGCGKSSVIEAVTREFKPGFREIRYFHLRPSLLKGNTVAGAAVVDPHAKPPRGALSSILRLGYLAADYIAGYLLRVKPLLIRTTLVIFDRYYYDMLIDSRRFRYGGPRWLLKLVAKLIPRPELVILLNAPAEVIWERKREVAFEEVVRQQQAYLALCRGLPSAVIIDAAQPLEAVIRDVNDAILSRFSRRTYQRLGLPADRRAFSSRELNG
jgi:thymidylate kinase